MADTTTTALADAINTLLDENQDLGLIFGASTFDQGRRWFTNAQAGRPSTLPAANGTVVTVAGVGAVLEMEGDGAGAAPSIYQRGYMPIIPGNSYRSRVRIRQIVDDANIGSRVYHGVSCYASDWSYLGDIVFAAEDTDLTVAEGWQTYARTTDTTTILATFATCAFIKSRVRPNCDAAGDEGDGKVQIKLIELRDLGVAFAISDDAYNASTWNGDATHAPSKNAVRDKFETLGSAALVADDTLVHLADPETLTGAKTFSADTTFLGGVNAVTVGDGSQINSIRIHSVASGSNGGGFVDFRLGGSSPFAIGNYSSIIGGSYDARPILYGDNWGIYTGGAYRAILHTGNGAQLGATNVFTQSVGFGESPDYRFHVGESSNTNAARLYVRHASFSNDVIQTLSTRAADTGFSFFSAYSAAASDREFALRGDGTGLCDGSWTGGGADYAEYFEWADGNPSAEDRRGVSVVLDGALIRPALAGEEPIGVISGNPSVVGDAAWNKWSGKYERDEFGGYVFEPYDVVEWEETIVIAPPAEAPEGAEPATKVEARSYALDALPEGVTPPADAARSTQQRRKLNPAFDPDTPYIPRSERKEWDAVGLLGKLRVREGQPVGARWVKMRDVSAGVAEWLVR